MHVVKAIAQFERTFVSGNSRFDKWKRGEIHLTEQELRGYHAFQSDRGDCFHCHSPPGHFTDYQFHNNGLDLDARNTGRGAVTGVNSDFGKWKTPSLRNVAVSGPYMHDGRFATLEEVLLHYQSVHAREKDSPNLAAVLQTRGNDQLRGAIAPMTGQERADCIAFLHALTDQEFLENTDFTDPGVAAP